MPNERLRLHLAGQKIGSYRLIQRISAGGMAEVYLAEYAPAEPGTVSADQTMHPVGPQHRQVAIKVVCPADEATRESGITDIEERFASEGALLQRLHHPHILPVYETGADRGYLYHVMEYVPNGSLADAICGRVEHILKLPLAPSQAIDIIRQVGSALEYIHEQGIVHRDVKPGNLLVRSGQQNGWHMLLADFGVACCGASAVRHEDQVTGTVAYMAPEVFSGWFSPASDQYSLGVMAFQLLSGHLPFEGTMDEQIAGHLQIVAPSVRMYVEDIPWEMEEVVARALEKHEVDRYPSVSVFVNELEAACHEAETSTTLASISDPETTPVATRASRRAHHQRIRTRPSYGVRAAVVLVTALLLLLATSIVLTAFPDVSGQRISGHASSSSPAAGHVKSSSGNTFLGTPPEGTVAPTISGITGHTSPVPATPIPTVTTNEPYLSSSDRAKLVALSLPSSVPAGQVFSFQLTLVNTGTSTWVGGQGYHLTCDWLRHPAQNCPGGFEATLGSYQVTPGRDVTFQIWLTALATPGIYTAWINMSHSSAPFATQDVFVGVQTLAASTSPAPHSASTPVPTSPQPTQPATTPAPTSPQPTQPASTPVPTSPQPTQPATTPAPTAPAATSVPAPQSLATPAPASESLPSASPSPTSSSYDS